MVVTAGDVVSPAPIRAAATGPSHRDLPVTAGRQARRPTQPEAPETNPEIPQARRPAHTRASRAPMHDPRISTALRQLADLGDAPAPPGWSWAVVGLERIGRVRLPAPAIQVLALNAGDVVWARSTRLALVVARTGWAPRSPSTGGAGSSCRCGCAKPLARPRRCSSGPRPAGSWSSWLRPECSTASVTYWREASGDRPAAAGHGTARRSGRPGPATRGPDLIAAHTTPPPPAPTLAEHIAAVTPTFSPGTATTYSSYWRLATEHLGAHRLTDITVVDLQLVVAEAGRRAQQRRPRSTGRSSQETCVAALRAVFNRAHAAGHIPANPAAALTKPRRARSRRRALDDHQLTELIVDSRVLPGMLRRRWVVRSAVYRSGVVSSLELSLLRCAMGPAGPVERGLRRLR